MSKVTNDLISREAAVIAIHNAQTAVGWSNGMHEMDIHKALAKVPAVDAAPVVHGRWYQCKLNVPKGKGQTYLVWGCNNCHKHERKRSDYCPNCGAKMKEEADK